MTSRTRPGARAVGVYRLWRDGGVVVRALVAGLIPDASGIPGAVWAVAALTAGSGIAVATRHTACPGAAWCAGTAEELARPVGELTESTLALAALAAALRHHDPGEVARPEVAARPGGASLDHSPPPPSTDRPDWAILTPGVALTIVLRRPSTVGESFRRDEAASGLRAA